MHSRGTRAHALAPTRLATCSKMGHLCPTEFGRGGRQDCKGSQQKRSGFDCLKVTASLSATWPIELTLVVVDWNRWVGDFPRESQAQRHALLAAVMEAAAEERTFVAESLHQGPQQILTALQLCLGESTSGASLVEVHSLVERLAASFRETTRKLAKPECAGHLSPALDAFASITARHLDTHLLTPSEVGTTCPTNVQSAIVSALGALVIHSWHPASQQLSLSVHQSGRELRIVIELEEFGGEIGTLASTASTEEIRETGGEVIAEREGDGATVVLRFPCDWIRR